MPVYDDEIEKQQIDPATGEHESLGYTPLQRQAQNDQLEAQLRDSADDSSTVPEEYNDDGHTAKNSHASSPVASDGSSPIRDKEENPEPPYGNSYLDDTRERLGLGFTGEGSQKSKTLSKMFKGKSKLKQRIAIAVAAAGFSAAGAVILFLLMLPLKLDGIIQNLDSHYGATTSNAMQKEAEQMYSGWVKNSLLPVLDKKACTRTIDPGCAPIDSGTGPIGRLYSAWRKDRLDTKLANNYGIVIARKSNNKFVMNIHSEEIDITALRKSQVSLFDLPGTKEVSSREIKTQLDSALEGETFFSKTFKRYFITKGIDKYMGTTTHCLIGCDLKEKVKATPQQLKQAAQIWISQRVIAPRSESLGVLMTCILTPDECSTSLEPSSDDKPERSKVQQKIDQQIETYLATNDLRDFAKLASAATDINKLGMTGYLNKLLVEKIASTLGGDEAKASAGAAVDKIIPIVGWVTLGLAINSFADKAPKILKAFNYTTNAMSAAQLYTTYKVGDDEMHSGNTDPTAYGSLVTSLGTDSTIGQTKSDMTSTPLYSQVISGKSGSSSKEYLCSDGKPVPSGSTVCSEENFTNAGSVINALNSFRQNPAVSGFFQATEVVSGILTPLTTVLNGLGTLFGDAITSTCSVVPGCSSALKMVAGLSTRFFSWAYGQLTPNPFADMSGGRTFDMIAAGSDVVHNNVCYQELGCAVQTNATIASIRNQQAQQTQESFNLMSISARLFSTKTPDSLISRIALALPTNIYSSPGQTTAGLLANPLGLLSHSFSSIFSSSNVFAAEPASSDPFGVANLGYASVPSDPEQTWETECAIPNSPYGTYDAATNTFDATAWYNNPQFQTEDPNTGQQVATQTNPCLLIANTAVSLGAMSDSSMIPPDTTQSQTSTTPTSPTTSQNTTNTTQSSGFISPIANYSGSISNCWRLPSNGANGHAGVDLPTPIGTPVLAVANGTVVQEGPGGDAGNYIMIQTGPSQWVNYQHLSKILVSKGKAVTQGQKIGLSGNTGNSTGPHLHFGVTDAETLSSRKTGTSSINPQPLLASTGLRFACQ